MDVYLHFVQKEKKSLNFNNNDYKPMQVS